MAPSFASQQSSQQFPNSQPIYQPEYSQPNQQYQNATKQSPPNYTYPPQQYPYPPQYPPQQAYPSYQHQAYPIQNTYQNFSQTNASQYDPQLQQKYPQTQAPGNQPPNQGFAPPSQIPQNSPLLRHSLSQIVDFLKKNLSEFSPEFQQKFVDNEQFKSLNRKIVFIPSFLLMGHVLINRKKKWFRLTVDALGIRRSLIGLLVLHLSTNFLYVFAYKDMIARNRQKIEKVIVRQEFLSGTANRVV